MDDVIENCATTFEEDGVNNETLADMRKVGRFPFIFSALSVILRTLSCIIPGDSLPLSLHLHHLAVLAIRFIPSFYSKSCIGPSHTVFSKLDCGRGMRFSTTFGGDAEHLTHFKAVPHPNFCLAAGFSFPLQTLTDHFLIGRLTKEVELIFMIHNILCFFKNKMKKPVLLTSTSYTDMANQTHCPACRKLSMGASPSASTYGQPYPSLKCSSSSAGFF